MTRLGWALLVALLGFAALVATPAHASGSVAVLPDQPIWQGSAFGFSSSFFPTKSGAFAQLLQNVKDANPPGGGTGYCAPIKSVLSDDGAFTITIHIQYITNGAPNGCGSPPADDVRTVGWYSSTAGVCPTHATGTPMINPSSCTCDGGYKPNSAGNACIPDCTANATASSGYFDVGTNQGASPQLLGCAGTCEAVFDGVSPAGSALVGGTKHWYAKGTYYLTGNGCSPGLSTKQVGTGTVSKPEDQCATGQAKGTVNGKTVCVDQSGDGTKPTDASKTVGQSTSEMTKTTNGDGSTTETETRTRIDSSGNKEITTIRTTTRPDGSQSVDRTVENPFPGTPLGGSSGTSGSSSGDDNTQKDECEKHPSSAGCGGDPASIGDLYTPKEKTFATVLTAHRDAFMASAFGSAVSGFFVVSGGGTCPTATAHIDFLKANLTFDQFCTPFATQALLLLKTALLLVACFFAFRVAVE